MSILYYKKDFLRHVQVGRQDWQACQRSDVRGRQTTS